MKNEIQLLMGQADSLLDKGRRVEALALYERISALDPSDTDAWMMQAAILGESNRLDEAIECCQKTIALDPGDGDAQVMLGRLLALQGRFGEASDRLEYVLSRDPEYGEAWSALSGVQLNQAKYIEAEHGSRQAVRLLPDQVDGYINLVNALLSLGRLDGALETAGKAVELDSCNAIAWSLLGLVLERLEKWGEAKKAYRKAVGYDSLLSSAYVGLVRSHLGIGEQLEAEQVLNEGLEILSTDAGLQCAMAALCESKKNLNQTEFHYRQALRFTPGFVQAWVGLGNVLQNQHRHSEAEQCYQEAIAVSPSHPEAHFNLGVCKQRQGQYDAARVCFDRAIGCRPDFVEAHWYQSFVCLLMGDYERGWDEYAWRLRQKQNIPRPFSQSTWDGSSLVGRTILVHDEQGYGDTFQFVRYLPLVKARGGRVIFECHPKLGPVLSGCAGYDEIHERISSDSTPNTVFDTQIHLLSLPRLFQTRPESIPADVPYIKANPERVAYWRDRVAGDTDFKIGIAWAGSANHTNELNRSCALAAFRPIADMPGVSLYSLQKGPGSEQVDSPPTGMAIKRLDKEMDLTERFVDTAALMVNLDLVISIDTSIVHLAGALGCPVWTLLCASPDWRWGEEGTHSPWYPSMRLFRQSAAGNWDGVMAEVCDALALRVQRSVQ